MEAGEGTEEQIIGRSAAAPEGSQSREGKLGRIIIRNQPIYDQAWREQAACLEYDPVMFFPSGRNKDIEEKRAKAVCAGCRVIMQCLKFAMQDHYAVDHGIYGGTSEEDRRAIKKRRRIRL